MAAQPTAQTAGASAPLNAESVAAVLGCAIVYFALYSSRRLVAQAPEEAAALQRK